MKACFGKIESSQHIGLPWKEIWYHPVPMKIQFLLWTATLGKISTRDKLRWKGFT